MGNTMEIEVYLYASLARYLPETAAGRSVRLSCAPGQTAEDIADQLQLPKKQIKLVFVNGVRKPLQTPLSDGDRLGLFPPVGGG